MILKRAIRKLDLEASMDCDDCKSCFVKNTAAGDTINRCMKQLLNYVILNYKISRCSTDVKYVQFIVISFEF